MTENQPKSGSEIELPATLVVPVRQRINVSLFDVEPRVLMPTQEFTFTRYLRVDYTPYYCYVCRTCGFAIGIDWIKKGMFDLLTHDCKFRCNHLTWGKDGWEPAFNRRGQCIRCTALKIDTCKDGVNEDRVSAL